MKTHHQIHVLHRDCADQDLIAHHQCAGKSHAVLESNFDGTDVCDELRRSVGQRDFLFGNRLQLQSAPYLLGYAKMQRARVRQCLDLHRL